MDAPGRFPINFKSELPARVGMPQKYFYHVVLGLVHGSKFGAIGLSRRTNLMDKKLEYPSLHDLIQNFDGAYKGMDSSEKMGKINFLQGI